MFITWPDMWYHSSEDTPDKQDSTQYKRAGTVGLGSLAVLASGTNEMAARVLADNLGRGLSRMGESHTKGLGYLADAKDASALTTAYKEARNAIQHQATIEKAVVRSAGVLWTNVDEGKKRTLAFEPLIDQRAGALLNEVKAAYQLQAAQRSVTAVEPVMSAEERGPPCFWSNLYPLRDAPRRFWPGADHGAEFARRIQRGTVFADREEDRPSDPRFPSGSSLPSAGDVLNVLRARRRRPVKITTKPSK
jgi:hypothetical protein